MTLKLLSGKSTALCKIAKRLAGKRDRALRRGPAAVVNRTEEAVVRKRKFAAGRFANGQDTRARDGDSGRRTITELRRPTVDRAAVVDANQSLQLERRTCHSPTLFPPPENGVAD